MNIEAKDLQTAIIEASKQLECSVVDLEYEIIQHPKTGFLGLFKKNAIIYIKNHKKSQKNDKIKNNSYNEKNLKNHQEKHIVKKEQEKPKTNPDKQYYKINEDSIFESFHKESKDTSKTQLIDEIRHALEKLLSSFDFDIKVLDVTFYDENCVLVKLDGEDAALLIGKEAHRYKAFSYLIYNWLNLKYKLHLRLEIAQFLENQNQAIDNYLKNIIAKVETTGKAQTKNLEGVWLKLALEKLRTHFPDKYVGIRQHGEQRFIIINDFLKKNENE